MEENSRIEWDRRYRERSHSSLTPDPFLVSAYEEFVAPAFPNGGTALDLVGGVGRHALYLAERGWQVTLVDVSPQGLALAESEAKARRVSITCRAEDLTEWELPASSSDLVVNFFYLERALFTQIEQALKPGGILIFKTYTQEQLKLSGGPTHFMHLLGSDELLHAFSGLQILHYYESSTGKAVAELVARKVSP